MPNFYLDSSENASDEPDAALSWHGTIEEARTAAIEAAKKAPGTIYFVHEVITSHQCVYRAEATVDITTEVLSGTPVQG